MSSPGDVIGVESCVDLQSHDVLTEPKKRCVSGGGQNSFTADAKIMMRRKKREYPPPLPSVAWEMKRYHTGDGRLIIREEKMSRRHDVFRAERSNGRLTLHIVPVDESAARFGLKNGSVSDDDDVFQMELDETASSTSSCVSSSSSSSVLDRCVVASALH